MKYVFGAIFAVLFSAQLSAQNLDDGFSPLKLFIESESIKGLQKIEIDDLWSAYEESEWMTTTYAEFDVKSLKNRAFFGLEVDRVEVVIMSDGESDGGSIWQFTLLIEDPGASAYSTFIESILNAYGPILTYSIHEDGSESPNWFSSESLLTVSGTEHRIKHDGKEYITVQFMSGVG